jgi:hypothetical protein
LTGSNRIPFHDQVNTRVQPECRPALSVRSAGAQAQSFHYTTQTVQRCRHHPLDDYNKRFNEQNKKHTFEIDFFSLLFKKVLILLIKEGGTSFLCRSFVVA